MFLMSVPVYLQVSLNIPGYVFSFISTLYEVAPFFFFGGVEGL
jgi:hypothetical protein